MSYLERKLVGVLPTTTEMENSMGRVAAVWDWKRRHVDMEHDVAGMCITTVFYGDKR
jgi:hypothetical protein